MPLNFRNTIIAGNGTDCQGTLTSQGYNLVQGVSGCTITGDLTGNITGQDALLGPLQDNGGPTMTHALLEDSPAIDSGDDSVLNAPHNLATDQRGPGFPRVSGTHVDIGAYEYQQAPVDTSQTSPFTVNKTGDTSDGTCGVADCSLREAISSGDSGDTVNVPMGTYTLTQGTELLIDKSLTLNGAGSGDTIIQAAASSADATSRVLGVTSGSVVAISDVTIQNGNDLSVPPNVSGGSGILNLGTLTLTSSAVRGNSAASGGGGIHNLGTLTLTSSTISANVAGLNGGGGILNQATLTLTNSTVSGNSVESRGGGIFSPNPPKDGLGDSP